MLQSGHSWKLRAKTAPCRVTPHPTPPMCSCVTEKAGVQGYANRLSTAVLPPSPHLLPPLLPPPLRLSSSTTTTTIFSPSSRQFTGPCEAVFEHLGKRVRPAPAGDSAPPRVAASRFFYDPPEVCAFAAFPSAAVRHWAYFRDSPGCEPGAVVESDDHRGSTFTFVGDNIFAAAVGLLEAAEAGSGGSGKASVTSGGATAAAAPGTAARGSLTSWLGATSSGGAGAGADAGAGAGTGAGAGAGGSSRARSRVVEGVAWCCWVCPWRYVRGTKVCIPF